MENQMPGEGDIDKLKFPTWEMDMKGEARNLWQGENLKHFCNGYHFDYTDDCSVKQASSRVRWRS